MKLALAVPLLLLAMGCATTSPTPRIPVLDLADWEVRGKLGVRSPERAGNLGFHWRQEGDRFTIRFLGPLGVNVGEVSGTAEFATARFDGELREGPINELLLEELGGTLPLSYLYWWIRAAPDPASPAERLPSGFRQAGWQIVATPGDAGLPRRLDISQGEAMKLRLAALRWQL